MDWLQLPLELAAGRRHGSSKGIPTTERPHDDDDDVDPLLGPVIRWHCSLPPVTRIWFSLTLVITILNVLEVLDDDKLIFVAIRVLPPHLELWKIITSFAWAGPGTLMDFHVLLLLYSITNVVPVYEMDPHEAKGDDRRRRSAGRRRRMSDCLFAFLVCSVLILTSYLLLVETSFLPVHVAPYLPLDDIVDVPILLPVFARTLLYSIISLDSLRHPYERREVNFFPISGRYVPLFHVIFGRLMGYRINEVVNGVSMGCVYHMLVTEGGWLASAMGRKRAIYAPEWLVRSVDEDDAVIVVIGGVGDGGGVDVVDDEDSYHPGVVPLEPGANALHRASAIGDVEYVRDRIDRAAAGGAASSSVTSSMTNDDATRPFRQEDRNGWQPLHEAARSGRLDVLMLLLEVVNDDDDHHRPVDEGTSFGSDIIRRRRRRPVSMLGIDVNATTGGGETALRLVEEHLGTDDECALLLPELGGVSLGPEDDDDDDDE